MKLVKMIPVTLISIFIVTLASAQSLIGLRWKFHAGDNPAWSDPMFDDSGWSEIASGTVWEQQGYPNLDGYAWYRTRVVIPSKFREKALRQDGFILNLGKVDDADITYFNGEVIGKTGDFPPNYLCAYDAERNYTIPVSKVRWDGPNVIAVRVFDNGGGGGLWGAPAGFTVKGYADQLTIEVAFESKDHIIRNQTDMILPVKVRNANIETLSGKLTLEVKSDFGDLVMSEIIPIRVGRESQKSNSFTIKNLRPGFYSAFILFESPECTKRHKYAFGVDPDMVVSPPDAQEDFADFWARAKKELAAVDPQFRMTRKDSICTNKRDWYLVEMRSLQNVLVRGWYSAPKTQGRIPAILHVQGYGTFMQPGMMVQDDDFVSFGLNIRGHGNSLNDVNPGFPGFLLDHLNDRECYIYRGAYMDCLRALDFLFSRPEVDTSRIVVEGQSQGGALSFATAALAPNRIRLCVPGVPFLSDFRHYFKVANWPGNEFKQYVENHPGVAWDQVFHTLGYFDIKNLAPWIKAPVLMSVGLMDETCPPHINFAAYNNLNVQKQYVAYPYSGHGIPGENYKIRMDWIRKQLGMNR
jgi:cephalosporin-C deacetylase